MAHNTVAICDTECRADSEEDDMQALRTGQIAGAGADVLSEEPPRHGNPLLAPDIANLIVTPHCAWGRHQARQRIIDQTVENVRSWLAGKPLRGVAGPAGVRRL